MNLRGQKTRRAPKPHPMRRKPFCKLWTVRLQTDSWRVKHQNRQGLFLGTLTRARKDSISAWSLCTWHEVSCSSMLRAAASFSSWVWVAWTTSVCCCGESGLRVSGDELETWSHLYSSAPSKLTLSQTKKNSPFYKPANQFIYKSLFSIFDAYN